MSKRKLNRSLDNAIRTNNYQNIVEAIDQGADFNKKVEGNTPLIFAIQQGYEDLALHLIRNQADIDAVGINGTTAIIEAAIEGMDKVVAELISKDVRVNCANKDGRNALMFASSKGNHRIVKQLLNKGLNVSSLDKNNYNALIFAIQNNHTEIAIDLMVSNADLTHRSPLGTPLVWASRMNNYRVLKSILRRLINNKHELIHEDDANMNALDVASEARIITLLGYAFPHAEIIKSLNKTIASKLPNRQARGELLIESLAEIVIPRNYQARDEFFQVMEKFKKKKWQVSPKLTEAFALEAAWKKLIKTRRSTQQSNIYDRMQVALNSSAPGDLENAVRIVHNGFKAITKNDIKNHKLVSIYANVLMILHEAKTSGFELSDAHKDQLSSVIEAKLENKKPASSYLRFKNIFSFKKSSHRNLQPTAFNIFDDLSEKLMQIQKRANSSKSEPDTPSRQTSGRARSPSSFSERLRRDSVGSVSEANSTDRLLGISSRSVEDPDYPTATNRPNSYSDGDMSSISLGDENETAVVRS